MKLSLVQFSRVIIGEEKFFFSLFISFIVKNIFSTITTAEIAITVAVAIVIVIAIAIAMAIAVVTTTKSDGEHHHNQTKNVYNSTFGCWFW